MGKLICFGELLITKLNSKIETFELQKISQITNVMIKIQHFYKEIEQAHILPNSSFIELDNFKFEHILNSRKTLIFLV